MDKFDASYILRQKILNFLNGRHGDFTTTEIAKELNLCRDYISRAIRKMVEVEEVAQHGPKWKATYTAVKTQTFKAEKARTRQRSHPPTKTYKPEPWRYVHNHDEVIKKDLSGQPYQHNNVGGGQGAIRDKVTIKSCM